MFALILASTLAGTACAQQAGGPPSGKGAPNPQVEAAMKACAAEQGASAPTAGSQPSGTRPDMQAFDACMSAKGFPKPKGAPPQGGDGGGNPPPGNG
ncbi:hypothetical protein [Pseudoxanthomonas sp.]|uniref:hypothetical protein n=1 Tax=Pseudoxanthomonas sp. TaxID=1871049 RepID=UPI002626275E|nr:hypothetical protein [Pseudoxanthomonas sp.]WDS35485.1 MAG: hypothetical protein O8I58_14210 [Pseudoxanthomonas sp.]